MEEIDTVYGLNMKKCLSFSYNGSYGLSERVYRVYDEIRCLNPHVRLEHDYKMVPLTKAVYGSCNDDVMCKIFVILYFPCHVVKFGGGGV